MKKSAYVLVGALAALLLAFGFNSAAQAYPEVQIGLTANRQVLFSGDSFTATANSNVDCTWNMDWNGEVRPGSGTSAVTTFTAPRVTKQVTIDLNGTCTYASQASGATRTATGARTWQHSIPITVMPNASGAGSLISGARSDLPGTGGPNRMFLLGGMGLLLAGATAVAVARRRAERAELSPQTA